MKRNQYAVIMAGGVGTRFWPLSRQKQPKQFIDFFGNGDTLFSKTYKHFSRIVDAENIFVVANGDYRAYIEAQAPGILPDRILTEPHPRNTAPCIAYAAFRIFQENPDATMVVTPSDHLIEEQEVFIDTIHKSMEFAAKDDYLVTLGIKPTRPDTGYGYIQFVEEQMVGDFFKVKTFTEKPNAELAEYFLNTGEFLWNAGIFVWKAANIIKAFETFLPDMHEVFSSRARYLNTPDEESGIREAYERCTNISIDYGIIEKANNVYVIPAEFTWSDVGTWKSLFELISKDKNQNALKGKELLLRKSSGCLVHSSGKKLVVLNNVENLIVVESSGVILVADMNNEQEIRQVVNEVKLKWGDKYT